MPDGNDVILTPANLHPACYAGPYAVYGRDSFPVQGFLAPTDEPVVLLLDQLSIGDRTWKQVYAVAFHGASDDQGWRQKSTGKPVLDIADEISRHLPLEALLVCNPAGFQLPLVDDKNPYTYPLCGLQGSQGIMFGELCAMYGKQPFCYKGE
ncbi:hypothetical protein COY28_06450 [Candidatus Woesearchaeota archaeon CG_4_10_14_0_2_um_filter_57_5]|nr:MAG: hypothetical protein COY28_06450 [Candidatus Woesearchaeota archaeon CG_4_10_14_0_2_um_filter_57_5]